MKQSMRQILMTCTLLLTMSAAFASAPPAADLLPGKWTGAATSPRGDVMTTTVALNSDASFAGTVEVNHKVIWSYGGTWVLQGKELVWTYTQSSIQLPEAAKTDTDVIVSLDSGTLVVQSKLSGEKHTFTRMK